MVKMLNEGIPCFSKHADEGYTLTDRNVQVESRNKVTYVWQDIAAKYSTLKSVLQILHVLCSTEMCRINFYSLIRQFTLFE